MHYDVVVADSFIEDAANVYSRKVMYKITANIKSLETSDFGLRKAPTILVERYGPHLRTIIVTPFYIFYQIDPKAARIEVLHLAYGRRDLGRWSRCE